MRYRDATRDDAPAVAALHADSWRVAYRGILLDDFLARDVDRNRADLWAARFAAPVANQLVRVAEDEDDVVGFACAYARDHERWGTLLDNLHVRRARQGEGIGRRLLLDVAAWCVARHPGTGLYLWVAEKNANARRFYERLAATDQEGDVWVPPDGSAVLARRYVWSREVLVRIAASS